MPLLYGRAPHRAVSNLPVAPAEASGPSLVSFDIAGLGEYVSQQIPCVAVVPRSSGNPRIFRDNYGLNNVPPGSNGEVAPCYSRLSYSDDLGVTWTHAAFFIPRIATDGVEAPHLFFHEGRLIRLEAYSGPGRRTIWGRIIHNPLSDSGFMIGSPYFLDYGYPNTPVLFGDEIRYCASEDLLDETAPFPDWMGNNLNRLIIEGNSLRYERISKIPNAQPEEDLNDFYEPSIWRFGALGVRCIFRTQGRMWMVDSLDDGATWGDAYEFTALPTGSTRCHVRRSPSGRLCMVYNDSLTKRERMAVAYSEDDGVTWPYKFVFDLRGAGVPRPSYPDVDFWGDLTLPEYDCGRGKQDDPTWTNELVLAIISEAAVVAGNGSAILRAVNF